MTMGQGGSNKATDAKKGMNATEVLTLANDIREIGRNEESHAIPSRAKATTPFQYLEYVAGGITHVGETKVATAAADTHPASA
jgi:hypothetical protein